MFGLGFKNNFSLKNLRVKDAYGYSISIITHVYYFKIPYYTICIRTIFHLKGETPITIYFSE